MFLWLLSSSPPDLERLNQMDPEREKEFDKLLDRMRAAFADVPEEQLMQDVAQIIERDREEQRRKAGVPGYQGVTLVSPAEFLAILQP